MTTVKNKKINIFQALNVFKITGRMRKVFESKYSEDSKTENDWSKEFKKQGLIFK